MPAATPPATRCSNSSANACARYCRLEDFPARTGGDEFAVLLFSADSPARAVQLGQQVSDVLSQSFVFGGVTTATSASVGVVPAIPGESGEALLAAADAAMYAAKRAGGGRVQLYSEELDRRVRNERLLATELIEAVGRGADGGLELHYQPILALGTGSVQAVEALAAVV